MNIKTEQIKKELEATFTENELNGITVYDSEFYGPDEIVSTIEFCGLELDHDANMYRRVHDVCMKLGFEMYDSWSKHDSEYFDYK